MSFEDFLGRILAKLDQAGVSYMLAGSVGSTFYGDPRATNDVDIVIFPEVSQLDALVTSLGPDYYVNPATAREALRTRSMFNVVELSTGWKADLIVRKDRPFSEVEFQRRSLVEVRGTSAWLATPEDVILSKLEWARLGGSERQFKDALGVAKARFASLDRDYLTRWAAELGVTDELNTLLEQAREQLHPPHEQGELFP